MAAADKERGQAQPLDEAQEKDNKRPGVLRAPIEGQLLTLEE
jgi:hypothetical protein